MFWYRKLTAWWRGWLCAEENDPGSAPRQSSELAAVDANVAKLHKLLLIPSSVNFPQHFRRITSTQKRDILSNLTKIISNLFTQTRLPTVSAPPTSQPLEVRMAKENGELTAAQKGKGKMEEDKSVNGDHPADETKKEKDHIPLVNGKKGEESQEGTFS